MICTRVPNKIIAFCVLVLSGPTLNLIIGANLGQFETYGGFCLGALAAVNAAHSWPKNYSHLLF